MPKLPPMTLKIPSELLPILAGSLLLLLIKFLLWLPPSQRFSAHLSASQSPIPELSAVFLSPGNFPELPKARKNCQEHRYGAARSWEVRREALRRLEPQKESNQQERREPAKIGESHRRNPISRRGGSLLKSARAQKNFKVIFQGLFLEFFWDMF